MSPRHLLHIVAEPGDRARDTGYDDDRRSQPESGLDTDGDRESHSDKLAVERERMDDNIEGLTTHCDPNLCVD